ncbi:MAG: hypothetical protein SGJ04_06725 [Bacteroidota bacterium]|nr:hypothetical protein [Bacteroidota bacterium]
MPNSLYTFITAVAPADQPMVSALSIDAKYAVPVVVILVILVIMVILLITLDLRVRKLEKNKI